MSQDYFKFLQQPAQNTGIQSQNGVNGANGAQKVSATGTTNVQRRYQFFTGFNNGANTGNKAENVDADNAIKSAEKILATITDETIKSKLQGNIDKVKELLEAGASESQIQAAVKELKDAIAQTTSIKPAMGI